MPLQRNGLSNSSDLDDYFDDTFDAIQRDNLWSTIELLSPSELNLNASAVSYSAHDATTPSIKNMSHLQNNNLSNSSVNDESPFKNKSLTN